MVSQLMIGFQKHYRNFAQKLFKNKAGKTATNKKENHLHAESHWNTVFNRHATYNEKIIEEIKQSPIVESLRTTPSKNEIRKATTTMKSDKAPGISLLTTDTLLYHFYI